MGFGAAVGTVFSKYATFSGRARRSEYWYFFLFAVLLYLVAGIVDVALDTTILGALVGLGLLLPTIAVSVRRLHDTGRSGWWFLFGLIPLIGTITLIVFYCLDTEPGTNRFGPSPKATGIGPSGYPTPGYPAPGHPSAPPQGYYPPAQGYSPPPQGYSPPPQGWSPPSSGEYPPPR